MANELKERFEHTGILSVLPTPIFSYNEQMRLLECAKLSTSFLTKYEKQVCVESDFYKIDVSEVAPSLFEYVSMMVNNRKVRVNFELFAPTQNLPNHTRDDGYIVILCLTDMSVLNLDNTKISLDKFGLYSFNNTMLHSSSRGVYIIATFN